MAHTVIRSVHLCTLVFRYVARACVVLPRSCAARCDYFAVASDWRSLRHVQIQTAGLVDLAIRLCPVALRFAVPSIQRDARFYRVLLDRFGDMSMYHASPTLSDYKPFVLAALAKGASLRDASQALRDDDAAVRAAVAVDAWNYLYASHRLKSCEQLAILAVSGVGDTWYHLPCRLRSNVKVLRAAIAHDRDFFDELPDEYQHDIAARCNKNMWSNQMTCVWDSLLQALKRSDVENLLGRDACTGPRAFVRALKAVNVYTSGVRWQGALVAEAQLRENQRWVDNYDEEAIHGGHLTSSADPFFMLICYLFHVRIRHVRPSCIIEYLPATRSRYTIGLSSRAGHMTVTSPT